MPEAPAQEPWLRPRDLLRAFVRAGLLLIVPLFAAFSRAPSATHLLVVLSFGAAIALPCFCEAWARTSPKRLARLADRAFLCAYLGSWLPVIEVLYLQAFLRRDPSELARAVDPAYAPAFLGVAVALLPVASALAAGSLLSAHQPWDRGRAHPKAWYRLGLFALRQGLLTGVLAWGLLGPLEIEVRLVDGVMIAFATTFSTIVGGVFLAAIYLGCDGAAALWTGSQGRESNPASHDRGLESPSRIETSTRAGTN